MSPKFYSEWGQILAPENTKKVPGRYYALGSYREAERLEFVMTYCDAGIKIGYL